MQKGSIRRTLIKAIKLCVRSSETRRTRLATARATNRDIFFICDSPRERVVWSSERLLTTTFGNSKIIGDFMLRLFYAVVLNSTLMFYLNNRYEYFTKICKMHFVTILRKSCENLRETLNQ